MIVKYEISEEKVLTTYCHNILDDNVMIGSVKCVAYCECFLWHDIERRVVGCNYNKDRGLLVYLDTLRGLRYETV